MTFVSEKLITKLWKTKRYLTHVWKKTDLFSDELEMMMEKTEAPETSVKWEMHEGRKVAPRTLFTDIVFLD